MIEQVQPQHRPSFNDVLANMESDCRMTAIKQEDITAFVAYVCTKHGNYRLGVFKTMEEAEKAIEEAETAQWNG